MFTEEDKNTQKRKIQGASVYGSLAMEASSPYSACPEDIKVLIDNVDLDNLVYWKLNSKLQEEDSSSQNVILKNVIAGVERPLFSIVLRKTNGNQSKAAELLGCNRNTLHRKLKDFSINPKDSKNKQKALKKPQSFKDSSLSAEV